MVPPEFSGFLAVAFNLQTSATVANGELSNSVFCLSRLRCKNPQKLGNLLPDVGGVAGQHLGLCDQFGPLISIVKGENYWLPFLRRRTVTTLGHVKSRFQIPRTPGSFQF